jgi:hypothetical protein
LTEIGFNLVDRIMAYEGGEITNDEVLELFAYLIKSGDAWSLQGAYGRAATWFIENGFLSPKGDIL